MIIHGMVHCARVPVARLPPGICLPYFPFQEASRHCLPRQCSFSMTVIRPLRCVGFRPRFNSAATALDAAVTDGQYFGVNDLDFHEWVSLEAAQAQALRRLGGQELDDIHLWVCPEVTGTPGCGCGGPCLSPSAMAQAQAQVGPGGQAFDNIHLIAVYHDPCSTITCRCVLLLPTEGGRFPSGARPSEPGSWCIPGGASPFPLEGQRWSIPGGARKNTRGWFQSHPRSAGVPFPPRPAGRNGRGRDLLTCGDVEANPGPPPPSRRRARADSSSSDEAPVAGPPAAAVDPSGRPRYWCPFHGCSFAPAEGAAGFGGWATPHSLVSHVNSHHVEAGEMPSRARQQQGGVRPL